MEEKEMNKESYLHFFKGGAILKTDLSLREEPPPVIKSRWFGTGDVSREEVRKYIEHLNHQGMDLVADHIRRKLLDKK